MGDPHDSNPQSGPAKGLKAEGGRNTATGPSTERIRKVWKACLKAVTPFSGAVKGMVPEPQEKWKALAKVFHALLQAPIDLPEGMDPLTEQVVMTVTGPPVTIDRTLRLLHLVPGGHPRTIVFSASSAGTLDRVQLSEWNSTLIVNRKTMGWNVTLSGARETRRYSIDFQGKARETGSDVFGERGNQDLQKDRAGRETYPVTEEETSKRTKAGDPAAREKPDQARSMAEDLEAAFSNMDRAEKKRQEELRNQREELERKAREAQGLPPSSKEKKPVSLPPEHRKDRIEAETLATPKRCVHCGDTLIEGKSFCASCGRPVPRESVPRAPEPAPVTPEICARCGAKLPSGKKFCPDCGTLIVPSGPEKRAPEPPVRPFQTPSPAPAPPVEDHVILLSEQVCPECHAVLKANATFCTACGTEVTPGTARKKGGAPPPPVLPLKPPKEACPHCGKALRPGSTFCTGCGRPLHEGTLPSPAGPPSPMPFLKCPNCGAPRKIGTRFCTRCGLSFEPGPKAQAPPPSVAKASAPRKGKKEKPPGQKRMGPGMMDTAMTFAPGLILDFTRRWPLYQQQPQMALTLILPCLMSFLSVGLAPKLGKWFAILLILISLGWLVYPMFLGVDLGEHIGRGLVGGSFLYTIMRLIRMVRR